MSETFHQHYRVTFELAVDAADLQAGWEDHELLRARVLASPALLHQIIAIQLSGLLGDIDSEPMTRLLFETEKGPDEIIWNVLTAAANGDAALQDAVAYWRQTASYEDAAVIVDSFAVELRGVELHCNATCSTPPAAHQPALGTASEAARPSAAPARARSTGRSRKQRR